MIIVQVFSRVYTKKQYEIHAGLFYSNVPAVIY